MKIIGICGSPRQKSNSTRMAEEVLKGAGESGAEVEIIKLGELNIKFCSGCLQCDETGKCHLEDDMVGILEMMTRADGFVLGTPSRWGLLSGNLKTFIDRLCPLSTPSNKEGRPVKFQGKKAVVVACGSCEGVEMEWVKSAADSVEKFCAAGGIEVIGRVICGGVTKPKEIEEKKEILEKCYQLGEKLVRLLEGESLR